MGKRKQTDGWKFQPISQRESHILFIIGEYGTTDEIGQKLRISKKTVQWHIYRIMTKTGIHKKELLIEYAHKHGYGQKKEVAC
jgi:DNA-binding CsgD family transcriptional regulator